MSALSRRGALQTLIAAGVVASLPAPVLAADWRAFADQHRWVFPTIEGACLEAQGLGYGPDDVYAMCRQFKPTRGVFLTIKDPEGRFWITGAH